MNTLLEKAMELPIPERLKLAEDIWASISEAQESFELTPEQATELERRIEYHRLHPEDTVSWETVKAGLLARR